MGDAQFEDFYVPFYMNFGSYFFGVLLGIFYENNDITKVNLKTYVTFQIFWWLLVPFGIVWMLLAHPFLQSYQTQNTLLMSIFAALQRNVWGLGLAVFIIGLTSKVGCRQKILVNVDKHEN